VRGASVISISFVFMGGGMAPLFLVGVLTGDCTGDLTGERTGDGTGDLTGERTGDFTANSDISMALPAPGGGDTGVIGFFCLRSVSSISSFFVFIRLGFTFFTFFTLTLVLPFLALGVAFVVSTIFGALTLATLARGFGLALLVEASAGGFTFVTLVDGFGLAVLVEATGGDFTGDTGLTSRISVSTGDGVLAYSSMTTSVFGIAFVRNGLSLTLGSDCLLLLNRLAGVEVGNEPRRPVGTLVLSHSAVAVCIRCKRCWGVSLTASILMFGTDVRRLLIFLVVVVGNTFEERRALGGFSMSHLAVALLILPVRPNSSCVFFPISYANLAPFIF